MQAVTVFPSPSPCSMRVRDSAPSPLARPRSTAIALMTYIQRGNNVRFSTSLHVPGQSHTTGMHWSKTNRLSFRFDSGVCECLGEREREREREKVVFYAPSTFVVKEREIHQINKNNAKHWLSYFLCWFSQSTNFSFDTLLERFECEKWNSRELSYPLYTLHKK